VLCAVCNAPCRGKCAKCQAPLCASHKPVSARSKCAICKKLGTGVLQAVQAIPPYPGSARQTPLPAATPGSMSVSLATLPLADQLAWIDARRSQLLKKQARERAYLDRRAARRTHTPTDDAYEADSLLEDELLEALDLLEHCLHGGASIPALPPAGARSTYAGNTSMLFPVPGPHDKVQP
jgi:hypothetical protein